jgi:hypothetical protein
MQLTRITIDNLRAIERFDADLSEVGGLPRRRVVLLGANGSGKTTILDAVAHGFQVLGAGGMVQGDDEFGAKFLGAGDVRIVGPTAPEAEETQRRGMIRIEAFLPEPDRERRQPPRPRYGSVTFPIGGEVRGLKFGAATARLFETGDEFGDDVRAVLSRAPLPASFYPRTEVPWKRTRRRGSFCRR